MKIERPRATVLRVTLGAYEMATLMAAIRWVLEGRQGDLPPECRDQLAQVLNSYELEMSRLRS